MRYINKQGKQLTTVKWLPNAGITVKGKWLLKDKHGTTMQLSPQELADRGYKANSEDG